MLAVNEQTSATLSLTFSDERGAAVIPTSGKYRIDDVATGTVITGWTAFTPTTSSYDITITSLENKILDELNDSEVRLVTVIVYYPSSKQCTSEYRYEITNLMEVPPALYVIGRGGAVVGGRATIV
jgi:hypothetical protein